MCWHTTNRSAYLECHIHDPLLQISENVFSSPLPTSTGTTENFVCVRTLLLHYELANMALHIQSVPNKQRLIIKMPVHDVVGLMIVIIIVAVCPLKPHIPKNPNTHTDRVLHIDIVCDRKKSEHHHGIRAAGSRQQQHTTKNKTNKRNTQKTRHNHTNDDSKT